LLIRAAAAECQPDARAELARRIAASSWSGGMRDALAAATGERPSPRLERRVTRRYLAYARAQAPGARRVARLVAAAAPGQVVAADLAFVEVPPPTHPVRVALRALYRLSPALGRLAHRGVRLGVSAVVAPAALRLVLEERWLAWRLRRERR
jgi:hypothetical protein